MITGLSGRGYFPVVRYRFVFLVGLCAALCTSVQLHAQAVYGSIVGTVVDSSGAAVANAKVIIRNVDRDTTNETTTNESGNYTQRYLIVGNYQVRVEAPGFQAAVENRVPVSVDAEVKIDMKLQVGELNQTVEVTSEAAMLKTERSDVATTYSQKQVGELPVLNRRFTTLQLMTPGVSLWPTSLTAAQPEN